MLHLLKTGVQTLHSYSSLLPFLFWCTPPCLFFSTYPDSYLNGPEGRRKHEICEASDLIHTKVLSCPFPLLTLFNAFISMWFGSSAVHLDPPVRADKMLCFVHQPLSCQMSFFNEGLALTCRRKLWVCPIWDA